MDKIMEINREITKNLIKGYLVRFREISKFLNVFILDYMFMSIKWVWNQMNIFEFQLDFIFFDNIKFMQPLFNTLLLACKYYAYW
jgi:hypothetical protein